MQNNVRMAYTAAQKPRTVEILFGHRLIEQEEVLQPLICSPKRLVLFADAAVRAKAETLQRKLSATLFVITGGETAKTRKTKEACEDFLLEHQFGRDTIILAMGGGAVTDLIAFVASTFLRSVPLILIPTTLLAMVDAAIGGKTAIDTPWAKNCIGTFYHPRSIWIDTTFLDTLPPLEQMNGLAEMLKMGLIYEPKLWNMPDDWMSDPLPWIERAVACKIHIVEQDPEEEALRRILNFGHTVAHALESLSNYAIPHGIAVAIGCQAESFLSHHLGYLSSSDLETIRSRYRDFPRPSFSFWDRRRFLEAISRDKKAQANSARFVLIDRIGHAIACDQHYCQSVAAPDLEALMDWIEGY